MVYKVGPRVNLDYYKGQYCVYKPILCQEGYCSECAIYYSSLRHSALKNENANVKNVVNVRCTDLMAATIN